MSGSRSRIRGPRIHRIEVGDEIRQKGQWDLARASECAFPCLRWRAHIDELESRVEPTELCELLDRQPCTRLDVARLVAQDRAEVIELTDDAVVSDTSESELRLD